MPRLAEGQPLTVRADYASVRLLADHLRDACLAAGLDEGAAFELELAMVEAANNVVEHGYAGRDDGTMALAVRIVDGEARLELTDGGSPVPEAFFADGALPPPDATGGRGAGIIRACVDLVRYDSTAGTNRLLLTKRVAAPAA